MRIIILFLLALCTPPDAFAKNYFYQIEENDQLGTIFLSLGHRRLWSKDGQVNLFKRQFKLKTPDLLHEGDVLRISEQDIFFKKNIHLTNDYIKIKNKIKTLDQFDEYQKSENALLIAEEEPAPSPIIEVWKESSSLSKPPEKAQYIQSLNLYPGLGGFVLESQEKSTSSKSSTFSGLQPFAEFKGIYSHSSFGSLAIDIMAKKIINDQFNFPINTDYRMQLIPKWNFTDYFRFAISHSMITHSYVGRDTSDGEIAYKLNSSFIGLGLIVPRDHYWFELFYEKAYQGKSTSSQTTRKISTGHRIDFEMVYPISENWKIIPGIKFYHLNQKATAYSLSVIEMRTTLSRSFEL